MERIWSPGRIFGGILSLIPAMMFLMFAKFLIKEDGFGFSPLLFLVFGITFFTPLITGLFFVSYDDEKLIVWKIFKKNVIPYKEIKSLMLFKKNNSCSWRALAYNKWHNLWLPTAFYEELVMALFEKIKAANPEVEIHKPHNS